MEPAVRRRAPAITPTAMRHLGQLLLGHFERHRDAELHDLATALLRHPDRRELWVFKVLNATIRARWAATRAVHLEPRWLVSRARFRRSGAETAKRHLSILCPTRGRVGGLDRYTRSLYRTAAAPERVELRLYVDDDDPALDAYRAFVADVPRRFPRLGSCAIDVGPSIGLPEAWNVMAARSCGDLLLMGNDDQFFVDHGWDHALDAGADGAEARWPDEVYCLYFDGGQYHDGGADFPIVSRAWYEVLGYFTPPIFQNWHTETWVFDLARRVERLRAVDGVFVEHCHYQDYKAPFDLTYQRHRLTPDKSEGDRALFRSTRRDRAHEADRLRQAIIQRAGQAGPRRPSSSLAGSRSTSAGRLEQPGGGTAR